MMFKNVADQKLTVFAFDATTSLPKAGDAANITAYYDLDDAGVTALTDTSASEEDATNAKGYYTFNLEQSETNGDKILFSAKSSTPNVVVVAVPAVVYTEPLAQIADMVWDEILSGHAVAGSAGFIVSSQVLPKVLLITSETELLTSGPISTGQRLTLYQGATYLASRGNAVVLVVPVATRDLSNDTLILGLAKLVQAIGTNSLEIVGTVTDPGGAAQQVAFELTREQTAALGLDLRALNTYRWTIAAQLNAAVDEVEVLGQGFVTVKPNDTTFVATT